MKPNVYFIGAGGIGMAALERYLLAKGHEVAGYDRTETDLTKALAAEGVAISFDGSPESIPANFTDPATTLVVYTPAVPESLPLFKWFRDNGFEIVKRAKLLGEITRMSKGLCFAGTHGKTTTSSMAAHLLHNSPAGCSAFLGGVLRNYGTNFLLSDSSPYTVIEADEYDRSFHHLSPYIAVITATDPDHLDIYGTEEAYLESFAKFTELIRPDGALIIHTGLKLQPRVQPGVKTFTYSRDKGDFHAENIRRGNGTIVFDCVTPKGTIRDINLGVPVEINIENAIAAIAAVTIAGEADADYVRNAMSSFMGPKRRFEFHMRET
ncbi:MAG: UDP-N-acetylmuramate--L-alanine ligase, partial [Paramuribaculum sp.]|nr:UDP-N-acetylmuramate--L-alanine ligase [Paramuribaculum sp.]